MRVLRFKRDSVKVSDVELGVYRLMEEAEREGDPVDLLERIRKEEKEADYVVVEQQSGERVVLGEVPERVGREALREGRTLILHPRMARLLKVALVRKKDMKEEVGFFRVNLSSIRWFSVESDVYVFDGEVKAPPDVAMIVLETEDGLQYVMLGS
ncbi:MAG: hypothetical protein ABDH61_00475 [Acidilobaceae archaeon]